LFYPLTDVLRCRALQERGALAAAVAGAAADLSRGLSSISPAEQMAIVEAAQVTTEAQQLPRWCLWRVLWHLLAVHGGVMAPAQRPGKHKQQQQALLVLPHLFSMKLVLKTV
jgi:hypothetical protein